MNQTKYSLGKGLIKFLKYIVIFAIAGLIVGLKPEIKELTVGGILVLVLNWIKIRWNINIAS